MHRALTIALGLGLGLSASASLVGAQEVVDSPTVTSDGDYVVATDDEGGDSDVRGEGTDIVVGDISTGNINGEVLGDPNAVYYPDLSAVPSITGQPHIPTIVGLPIGNPNAGDLIPGIDVVFSTGLVPATAPAEAAPSSDAAPAEAGPTTDTAPAEGSEMTGEPVDDEAGVPIDQPAG